MSALRFGAPDWRLDGRGISDRSRLYLRSLRIYGGHIAGIQRVYSGYTAGIAPVAILPPPNRNPSQRGLKFRRICELSFAVAVFQANGLAHRRRGQSAAAPPVTSPIGSTPCKGTPEFSSSRLSLAGLGWRFQRERILNHRTGGVVSRCPRLRWLRPTASKEEERDGGKVGALPVTVAERVNGRGRIRGGG